MLTLAACAEDGADPAGDDDDGVPDDGIIDFAGFK
jgi:hypothetical protein